MIPNSWRQRILLLATLALAFFLPFLGVRYMRSLDAPRVLRHIVLYKCKESTTAAQIAEVVEAFQGLPSKIPGVVGFEHGTNISPEGKSEGFTHSFLVTFPDETARDGYLVHPAHDAFVAIVRERREKVIVLDYWSGP